MTQVINLKLSNKENIIEKVPFSVTSKKVIVNVEDGAIALIKDKKYYSGNSEKLNFDKLVLSKNSSGIAYLYNNRLVETTTFDLFVDELPLVWEESEDEMINYCLSILVSIKIFDHELFAQNFQETMSKDNLFNFLRDEKKITGDCSSIIRKNLSKDATKNDVKKNKSLYEDELKNSVNQKIKYMGIKVASINDIELDTTPQEDERLNKLRFQKQKEAAAKLAAEEKQKERDHEINLEKAKNTRITDKTEKIHKTINGSDSEETNKKYIICPNVNCGLKIDSDSNFCKHCGKSIR